MFSENLSQLIAGSVGVEFSTSRCVRNVPSTRHNVDDKSSQELQ